MRWFRFAILVLVAAILQTAFVDMIWILDANIKPDLLLILLVFFAVRCQPTDAVIASFVIGFAADLASPVAGFMGPRIISFGLFGTLLNDLHNFISIRWLPYQAAAIFVMGAVTALASHLLAYLRAEPAAFNFARQCLWQPALSGVIGPFFFLPVGWWMHMNDRKRRRRLPGPGTR
jgi:cell shape-determining protein MreD